jgi:uncharacterized protein YndB with AHSA1/START domain
MPPVSAAASRTTPVIDTQNLTITFRQTIAAPPARVYSFWTEPEHLKKWWDASGEELLSAEVDLRIGGSFRFVSARVPETPFTGQYREVVPSERLVFEAMGAVGTIEFAPIGDKATRLIVEIRCVSLEALEHMTSLGVAEGTAQTIDNLVDYATAAQAPV